MLFGAKILHTMHTADFEGLGDPDGATEHNMSKKVRPAKSYDFKKNHQFSKNFSSLPLRRTHFVTKERHITDMSIIRKKII